MPLYMYCLAITLHCSICIGSLFRSNEGSIEVDIRRHDVRHSMGSHPAVWPLWRRMSGHDGHRLSMHRRNDFLIECWGKSALYTKIFLIHARSLSVGGPNNFAARKPMIQTVPHPHRNVSGQLAAASSCCRFMMSRSLIIERTFQKYHGIK